MPYRNESNVRPDNHEPIQVRLVPQSGPAHILSPVLTTAHAKPVSMSRAGLPSTGPDDDITALIDASDNPLKFFLDRRDAFPTPDALDDHLEDGDFFLDSGIEDSRHSTPPTLTTSPSHIPNIPRVPSPLSRGQTKGDQERVVINRPHSPHPAAMGLLSNFLVPPPPPTRPRSPATRAVAIPNGRPLRTAAAGAPSYKPEKPSLLSFSYPRHMPWSSDSGSDSDVDSEISVRSVPVSLNDNGYNDEDDDDGEDYIHFLSGGVGMAGSGSFYRSTPPSSSAPPHPPGISGAHAHSYPPYYPEYVPLRHADAGTGTTTTTSAAGTTLQVPPRGMSPTYHRRGRSLKARSRRGAVAHSGRWRWAAREPSPDVWSIEETREEEEEESAAAARTKRSATIGATATGVRGGVGSSVNSASSSPIVGSMASSSAGSAASWGGGGVGNMSFPPSRLGSPNSFLSATMGGRRPVSPAQSFGSRGRGVSPARSVRSDDSDDMGLKRLRRGGSAEEGEVLVKEDGYERDEYDGDDGGDDDYDNGEAGDERSAGASLGRLRRVRFVLPIRDM